MRSGTRLILGILAVAAGAASFAWWHQWSSGDQALSFWGSPHAARIKTAPRVELLRLGLPPAAQEAVLGSSWGGDHRSAEPRDLLQSAQVRDISHAPGLGHARQALIVDASFDWERTGGEVPPHWTHALRFTAETGETIVLFDLPRAWVQPLGSKRGAGLTISQGLEEFFGGLSRSSPPSPRPPDA